ncbi:Uncharacterised protein [Mycobacteroides abscessus subsp. abscessus]|nr:Uncharacterised protein [Mycobacteroides abscessus subsp. abscessus]
MVPAVTQLFFVFCLVVYGHKNSHLMGWLVFG